MKNLTEREFEVLKLIVKGKSNIEIADELMVSENTIKAHVKAILNKFNVQTRIMAAIAAVKENIL